MNTIQRNTFRVEASPASFLLCLALALSGLLAGTAGAATPQISDNEPGIMEPVSSHIQQKTIRVPNTDQSVDGVEQSLIEGSVVIRQATMSESLLGYEIQSVSSPNEDMRLALAAIHGAAGSDDRSAMESAAEDLKDILMGTTQGRLYDGFSMLNFNRWKDMGRSGVERGDFPHRDGALDVMANEYKMKLTRRTGETFTSPFDGETRDVWEVDINLLYYDGQIDSDTFLVRFPYGHHPDDVLHINYRIFSQVQEDFSPTLVMLDRREAQNTVNFPFKGFDAVWTAFEPGEVVELTVKLPPIRMIRGIYDWGWRVHPPRIQFMQPIYEIMNQWTGEVELDPQSESFAYRNREELTLSAISSAAPEMKMLRLAEAILDDGASFTSILEMMDDPDVEPRGRWFEWAELAREQRQLPPEAWDVLAEEDGLEAGDFGDYEMVTVYMNNEMYGQGPFGYEIRTWKQGDAFDIKLINMDRHTHYFRNVDFGARLHDDILRCCGGGETSFEIMNFKPSYGAPKVAEMQWRAGWGFRPHYDVIQQQGVFSRGIDSGKLKPYRGGYDGIYFGYQYSDEARQGDFRFNPPPFVIHDAANPAPYPLRDADGGSGLVIGQKTEGYGVGQVCPQDAYPGFCSENIAEYNPHGVLNWPPPPLQGVNGLPDHPTELRFPPFLRNPCQGESDCGGDIIAPTGAWRPFLWYNPANGTIFNDPDNPEAGFWADKTYSHGTPVFAGETLAAHVELPRAAGQVFYQFDDLFHDNSIFSPHPLFTGFGEENEADEIRLRAFRDGDVVRVRGRALPLSTGEQTGWVTVHAGAAGESGCEGEALDVAPTNNLGRFVFRCGGGCQALELGPQERDNLERAYDEGSVCVQSPIGGFVDAVVEPEP